MIIKIRTFGVFPLLRATVLVSPWRAAFLGSSVYLPLLRCSSSPLTARPRRPRMSQALHHCSFSSLGGWSFCSSGFRQFSYPGGFFWLEITSATGHKRSKENSPCSGGRSERSISTGCFLFLFRCALGSPSSAAPADFLLDELRFLVLVMAGRAWT